MTQVRGPIGSMLLSLACLFLGALDDRFAVRGPQATTAVRLSAPALLGGPGPVEVHGVAPATGAAPIVLIAACADASTTRYDALLRHLATHGCAAFVVARPAGLSWWRYAELLIAAAHQIEITASIVGHPLHGRLDLNRCALLGDGDGAMAVARAAGEMPALRALVLVDAAGDAVALPWIAGVHAPFLSVTSMQPAAVGADEEATDAEPIELGLLAFQASGAAAGRRWQVQIAALGPLLPEPAALPRLPDATHDLHALLARFFDATLDLRAESSASLERLDRFGRIAHTAMGGPTALPAQRDPR